jgi:hypothetical protein
MNWLSSLTEDLDRLLDVNGVPEHDGGYEAKSSTG